MIVHTRNSQRVPPCSARESRLPPSMGSRDELHQSARHDGLIVPEAQHEGLHNFTDQAGTVVLIGIARHGLGTIVRPFLFKSFHRQPDSQGS